MIVLCSLYFSLYNSAFLGKNQQLDNIKVFIKICGYKLLTALRHFSFQYFVLILKFTWRQKLAANYLENLHPNKQILRVDGLQAQLLSSECTGGDTVLNIYRRRRYLNGK